MIENSFEVQERKSFLDFKKSSHFRDLRDVDVEYQKLRLEKVILVGVWQRGSSTEKQAGESLEELALLAETAGAWVLGNVLIHRNLPDKKYYIGKGKLEDLEHLCYEEGADTVVFDNDLSPSQRIAIENHLQIKVIDRTALILDIFALHAKSKEGKAQVELAQLKYLLPRLRGWGQSMSRQAGGQVGSSSAGMGSRGPGETQLELDRRALNKRITHLKKLLSKMEKDRITKRKNRQSRKVLSASIVGYTNSGKSSLLRALTGYAPLIQDALFATVDTTTKRLRKDGEYSFTISDTVGFISNLPTTLIEAFASTLEESVHSNLLVHVVDASSNNIEKNINVVNQILRDVRSEDNLGNIILHSKYRQTGSKEILVFNKIDLLDSQTLEFLKMKYPEAVFISVKDNMGIKELKNSIYERLLDAIDAKEVVIPYEENTRFSDYCKAGNIITQTFSNDGIHLLIANSSKS
ncbi:MAG: GTPase HflX [Bifidobacteriaceae bacterium]|jgi:GTP-binding protein HflX|nr:GTPase HflX [Bifidobacteriaceae bacterium]